MEEFLLLGYAVLLFALVILLLAQLSYPSIMDRRYLQNTSRYVHVHTGDYHGYVSSSCGDGAYLISRELECVIQRVNAALPEGMFVKADTIAHLLELHVSPMNLYRYTFEMIDYYGPAKAIDVILADAEMFLAERAEEDHGREQK